MDIEEHIQEMNRAMNNANKSIQKIHNQMEIINYALYLAEQKKFNSYDRDLCTSILVFWRNNGRITPKQEQVLANRVKKYKKRNPMPEDRKLPAPEPICLIED